MITQFGFEWGTMVVERIAHDERIGWVLIVKSRDSKNRIEIRSSPKGQNWSVTTIGKVEIDRR